MEQQRATFENARRIAAAWLVLVPVFLAGCAETPAHVVDTDRTDTAYSPESDDDADAARVIVHEGDTLTRIAARCDTSIAMLVRLNDFGDNWSIYPGEILRIPPRHCDQRTAIPRPEPRPDYFPRDVASDAPPVQRRIDRADPHQDADATSTENSWWSWWTGKSSETQDTASRFIWPVRGAILEAFGPGRHGERNDGINIATSDGAPIRASASGIVTYTGNELKGYGNLVLIKHADGYVTAYAHAGSIRVARGDHVERGQVIATAGETGDVDRPQLHFEIRKGAQAVDPQRYLADRAS